MTPDDVFAVLGLLAAGAAGGVRGGTRELLTLLSFVLAAFIALIALPFSAPIGKALVDPDWAGTLLAALASFLLVYFGVRIFGSTLSRRAQAHPHLGGIDRFFGIFVGLARALVLIGAIHLVVVAAMPGEKTPRWHAPRGRRTRIESGSASGGGSYSWKEEELMDSFCAREGAAAARSVWREGRGRARRRYPGAVDKGARRREGRLTQVLG